jgi:hypothetical protein
MLLVARPVCHVSPSPTLMCHACLRQAENIYNDEDIQKLIRDAEMDTSGGELGASAAGAAS